MEGQRHWDSAWGGWAGGALVSAWCLVPGAQSPFHGTSYCWRLPGAGKGLSHSHPKVEQTVTLRVLTLSCTAFLSQLALSSLRVLSRESASSLSPLGTMPPDYPPVPTSRECPQWMLPELPPSGDPLQRCGDLSQPSEVDKDHTLLVPHRDEDRLWGLVSGVFRRYPRDREAATGLGALLPETRSRLLRCDGNLRNDTTLPSLANEERNLSEPHNNIVIQGPLDCAGKRPSPQKPRSRHREPGRGCELIHKPWFSSGF